MKTHSIEDALAAIARGEIVVVADDANRENEGDLIMAADCVTPEKLAFINRYSSGVICVALSAQRLEHLQLPLMVECNTESHQTAYTITVDYKHGTTTGISAADRSATIQALANPMVSASDFNRPGHVFPLRYREGGVLTRPGHTEAAADLARLAGRADAGVLCEVVNDDGTMTRGDQLRHFAQEHGLVFITIADLIAWRQQHETPTAKAEWMASARLPTAFGEFQTHIYRSSHDQIEHVVITKGQFDSTSAPLVRLHSECFTGDILGSLRCDCGEQLQRALREIEKAGTGAVIYLRGHEGRGIGLGLKLQAYTLQDQGHDTVEANEALGQPIDARNYQIAATILNQLGIKSVRLLSNNPEKAKALIQNGIQVLEHVSLITEPNCENLRYLRTKQHKMGHLLNISPIAA